MELHTGVGIKRLRDFIVNKIKMTRADPYCELATHAKVVYDDRLNEHIAPPFMPKFFCALKKL